METFIDLMSNVTYTPSQIEKRLGFIEKKTYSRRSEQVLNRIGTGEARGKRPSSTKEKQIMSHFQVHMEEVRAMGVIAAEENALLIGVIDYEQSLARLEQYTWDYSQPGQDYEAPVYDYTDPDNPVLVTPEVPYIPTIMAIPEYIESGEREWTRGKDGDPKDPDNWKPIMIRNPTVITDEEERADALVVITSAATDELNLYHLRNPA